MSKHNIINLIGKRQRLNFGQMYSRDYEYMYSIYGVYKDYFMKGLIEIKYKKVIISPFT